jgi:hypothetical protein
VVLCIGRYLVDAHYYAGNLDRAIALCDTIYYNLRQSRGGLDKAALDFAQRLSTLLEGGHRARDAVRLHEDVVSDLDERLRAAADAHLDGLRRCGWASRGDGLRASSEIYGRLKRYGTLTVPPVEQWASINTKEEKRSSVYVGQTSWILVGVDADKEGRKKKRDSFAPAKERWGCWEAKIPELQRVS